VKIDAEAKRLFIQANLKNTENLLSSSGYLNLRQMIIGNSFKINRKRIGIDLNMRDFKNNLYFIQGSLHSGKATVNFDGKIENAKNTRVIMNFESKNTSVKEIAAFYPFTLTKIKNKYLLTDGAMDFKATITVAVSSQTNPDINVQFYVRNASVMNQNNRKRMTGISIDGDFSNGPERNNNTTVLNIKKFSAKQGKSLLNGALKIKGLNGSNVELILHSEIQISEMFQFLNIDTFEDISGTINTDVHLIGYLSSLKKINRDEMISFKKEGIISCREVTLKPKNTRLSLQNLNGNLILENIIKLRDISFMISDNDFKIDGNLINLPQFLINKESLLADVEIRSEYLYINSLLNVKDHNTTSGQIIFPNRILLRSHFNINRLTYGKFTADSIAGLVTYNPKVFHFEKFYLHAVDGFISGNAKIMQTPDRGIAVTCSSKLGKIDIQKLFYATNNFGQDVILDKNLMGELSGNLNFTSEWNNHLKLIDSSIIANSDIEIKNGQLIDYEPMLGLSRFVNVEELKDIKFKTLSNQIYIGNRKVIIPEMHIHSSAFNIKGSGTHHFDNSYDYRIQVELNELLSNKVKKRRKDVEKFGTIEEDGLGRLNLPIKITGRGSASNVEFDWQKATSTFRNNIASEKEEIKDLFKHNQTGDNLQNLPDAQNKNFIIDWDTGNEKKDFIFEKNVQKEEEQPQFFIEWDENNETENRDTTIF
jgi:hypothetical protein